MCSGRFVYQYSAQPQVSSLIKIYGNVWKFVQGNMTLQLVNNLHSAVLFLSMSPHTLWSSDNTVKCLLFTLISCCQLHAFDLGFTKYLEGWSGLPPPSLHNFKKSSSNSSRLKYWFDSHYPNPNPNPNDVLWLEAIICFKLVRSAIERIK